MYATNFDLARINGLLEYYGHENYDIDLPDSVSSYAEFVEKFPIKHDQSLREDVLRLGSVGTPEQIMINDRKVGVLLIY